MAKINFLFATIFLILLHKTLSDKSEEFLLVQLELIDFDLEDECEDLSRSLKNVLFNKTDSYQEKISIEEGHGKYLRKHSKKLKEVYGGSDSYPFEIERNVTLLIKNGDTLLEEDEYKKLVKFHNNIEELTDNVVLSCIESTEKCNLKKQEVKELLETSRNDTELEEAWTKWQDIFRPHEEDFKENLKLITKAAEANDLFNPKDYWEMLAEYEDGYSHAKTIWEEIEPIYKKVYDYVLLRINLYYGTNFTELPIHLLGSNFGEDWSKIADIVLPKPQFLYDVNLELEILSKKEIFKLAESMTKGMGLGKLGKEFWAKSKFNHPNCDINVLPNCAHRFSEVITCNRTSIVDYLDAHEAAMQIILNNQDYSSYGRQRLRYSAYDEAMTSLGTILGLGNLPFNGILDEDFYRYKEGNTGNTMSALFMTALRVLPKLAFYMTADIARLDELELPSTNFSTYWWDMRLKYQGVISPTSSEADYIADPIINFNKPYLSKFLGLVLQFQILDYYQVSMYTENADMVQAFKDDNTFKDMMQDRPNKNALSLVSYYYGIDEISAYNLKTYFEPLMEYLDTAPTDQEPVIPHERRTTTTTTTTEQPTIVTDVVIDSDKKHSVKSEPTKNIVDQPRTEDKTPMSDQKAHSYIFIAVASGIIILTIIYGVVQGCRKKIKSNNRRFQA